MQIPIPLSVRKSFNIGQTVSPATTTWYTEKYKWRAALIYDFRKSSVDNAVEAHLKGVSDGVEFDFWEYVDYLKLK